MRKMTGRGWMGGKMVDGCCASQIALLAFEALQWSGTGTQMSDVERTGLRGGNGVEYWKTALGSRFRESRSDALRALQQTRFTLADVRNDQGWVGMEGFGTVSGGLSVCSLGGLPFSRG